ncbi:helicase [Microbacterium sp. LWH3-1.2]|uniref:helicase n=1 Tax=Microbacterium sp. LWH3-1.2 TaxID=3135256 RepID=UPI003434F63F
MACDPAACLRPAGERTLLMAGTMAAVGIISAAALLAVGLAGAGAAAAASQRLASAADAGALAAADAASGAIPGVPCDRAAEVAGTFGAVVEACELDELIATVTVSMRLGPVAARASARAGPPP